MSVRCSDGGCSAARLTLGWLGKLRGWWKYALPPQCRLKPPGGTARPVLGLSVGTLSWKDAAQCVAMSPVKVRTAPKMRAKAPWRHGTFRAVLVHWDGGGQCSVAEVKVA
jgi:hypothetical protein